LLPPVYLAVAQPTSKISPCLGYPVRSLIQASSAESIYLTAHLAAYPEFEQGDLDPYLCTQFLQVSEISAFNFRVFYFFSFFCFFSLQKMVQI